MNRVSAAANAFLDLAKEDKKKITNLQLVKMLYVAQGMSLAIFNKPLFDDDRIEAWRYGPVIPSIYHEFKQFKDNPIESKSICQDCDEYEEPELVDERKKNVVLLTWKLYKDIPAERLIQLTHKAGTPWDVTDKRRMNETIDNEAIKKYYTQVVNNLKKNMEV